MDRNEPLPPEDVALNAEGENRRRRPRMIALGALVVAVFGGGAYGIAHALSSPTDSVTGIPGAAPLGGGSAPQRVTSPNATNGPSGTTGVAGPVGSVGGASNPASPRPRPFGATGAAGRFAAGGAAGTVSSLSGSSFVLTSRAGTTVTVEYNSATRFRSAGTTGAGAKDLKVGESVFVTGETSGSVLHATSISIGLPGFGGRGGGFFGGTAPAVAGSVVSTGPDRFTVQARTGTTTTVVVQSTTTYRAATSGAASFSAVKSGEVVFVAGTTDSKGIVHATSVTILPANPTGGGLPGVGAPGGSLPAGGIPGGPIN